MRQLIGVVQRLHIFLLHIVFLRDLLSGLLQVVHVRLEFGRRTSFRLQELDHVIGETPVLLDPFHVMLDKIDHVVQGPFDIFLFRDLFARFKYRLDRFRAATGAGAMNPRAASAMMGAQLSTGNVEDGIGRWPAQRRLQDIDRRRDGEGCILSVQEIDERFALGRNLLAQVIERVIAVEPDGIIV